MIRIVRGNRFRLLIPLELTTTEGGVSKTEKYTPTERCRVCVRKASASYDVPHSVQDTNVLVVDIAADLLGNGTYAVEVTDTDVRSMRLAQFAIVETTEEADIKQPTDFELQTAALDAQVFFGGITENDVKRIVDEHLGIPKDANGEILITKEHS